MLALSALIFFVAVLLFVTFRFASFRVEQEVIDIHPEIPKVGTPPSLQPPIFLSTVPATMAQKYFAVTIVMAMLAMFAVVIPFAHTDGPTIPAFPPVTDALLSVMYFIIGFIITGQYLRLQTWSLLVLASGFYFQSTMAFIHMMTFPGFIAEVQPTAVTPWIYLLWQGGFPLFVIAYAFLHGRRESRLVARLTLMLAIFVITIVVLCVVTAIAIITFQSWFPAMVIGLKYTDAMNNILGPTILTENIIALILLWLRGNSVLDVWLMVSMSASIMYVTIASIIGNERFDVSYYVGRVYGVLAAALVLAALLEEMNRLYASVFAFMERRQSESDAKYQAVFDTTIDAILVIDQVGIVKSFNHAAERMFGYPAAEVIEQNIKMLMPEPYHSGHDHYLKAYHDTGIRKIIGIGREVQGKRKDGSILVLDLAVTEWQSDNEQLFTGILRDVSERKRLEQQLIQSQKMEAIGQLSGGMAHDFNNILGVVIGNLDMLMDYFPDKTPLELTEAITASVAGADLVQRLLAFSRRQPLLPKLIALNELVEDLMPLVRRIIGGQIEIEAIYDNDLLPVVADPAQFENALLNLVINARDAMPTGGKLMIECRSQVIDDHSAVDYDVPTGSYTTLVVSDTGTGIPPEIIERVFDPFFTTKPPGMGSGLGLSMVFGYAKQSGGVVRIYSEVGAGTSVRLYLPSVNGEIDENALLEADSADMHGNERILVVEDMASARTVAQRILVSLGYNVLVAKDATEAIQYFDAGETFDLLFTDIIMPGMTGVTLAQIIKKRYPQISILFTSGFSRTPIEDVNQLSAYSITKPYRKIDLAVLLRKIFNKRG